MDRADRASRSDPFGNVTALPIHTTLDDFDPAIAANGTRLYLTRYTSGAANLLVSMVSGTSFSPPVVLSELRAMRVRSRRFRCMI